MSPARRINSTRASGQSILTTYGPFGGEARPFPGIAGDTAVSFAQRLRSGSLAAASAYELLQLTGPLPDDLLEGMVAVTDSINDAPKDDLEVEDDVFSPERLRAYEEAQAKSDRTTYRVIARHKDTGELAGHTVIAVERERPYLGEQHDTAVARANG